MSRHNSRRITGIEAKIIFDSDLFCWRPKSCGHGEILVWWLGFGLHISRRYH